MEIDPFFYYLVRYTCIGLAVCLVLGALAYAFYWLFGAGGLAFLSVFLPLMGFIAAGKSLNAALDID